MRKFTGFIGILALFILPTMPFLTRQTVASEAADCPGIVTSALKAADQLCKGAGRNQACYGHITLEASPQSHVTEFAFDEEGDVVDVVDVHTLRLSAMDVDTGSWGVALMRVQAGLKEVESSQPITVLLFGDIEIENAGTTPTSSVDLGIATGNNVNVRSAPSTGAQIIGKLAPGQIITANGRLANGTWLRVVLPAGDRTGWVSAALLEDNDAISSLDVVEASSRPVYGPMQAFYFRSGTADTATCPQANNGLLIQTPEGVAKVSLLINEVDIQLGSTVFFQAQPGEQMTISVVEGSARVETFGVTQKAYAGSRITVPISDDLKPAGPPAPPEAYDMAEMEALPIDYLPRSIIVHEPLTEDELAAAEETFEREESAPTPAGDDSSTPDSPSESEDPEEIKPEQTPPGLIDNPGLDGSLPPGQGGSPPGQDDKDKEDKDK